MTRVTRRRRIRLLVLLVLLLFCAGWGQETHDEIGEFALTHAVRGPMGDKLSNLYPEIHNERTEFEGFLGAPAESRHGIDDRYFVLGEGIGGSGAPDPSLLAGRQRHAKRTGTRLWSVPEHNVAGRLDDDRLQFGHEISIRDLVRFGVQLEDSPTLRAQHHFHEPQTNHGLDDTLLPIVNQPANLVGFLVSSTASLFIDGMPFFDTDSTSTTEALLDFACAFVPLNLDVIDPPCPGSFDRDGMSAYARALGGFASDEHPPNGFAWDDARRYYFQAMTRTSTEERSHFGALTFLSLGQVVHLLQDMGVPPHTRNDFWVDHMAGRVGGYIESYTAGGKFQDWDDDEEADPLAASQLFPVLMDAVELDAIVEHSTHELLSFRDEADIPLSRFWDSDVSGINNTSPSDHWGLSEYSHFNFYSNGTVIPGLYDTPLDVSYPTPAESDALDPPLGSDRLQYSMSNGRKVKIQYLRRQLPEGEKVTSHDPDDGYYIFAKEVARTPPLRPSVMPGAPAARYPAIDARVWRESATILVPRSAAFSSALIQYFFRGSLEASVRPTSGCTTLPCYEFVVKNSGPEPLTGSFFFYFDDDQCRPPDPEPPGWEAHPQCGQEGSLEARDIYFRHPVLASEPGAMQADALVATTGSPSAPAPLLPGEELVSPPFTHPEAWSSVGPPPEWPGFNTFRELSRFAVVFRGKQGAEGVADLSGIATPPNETDLFAVDAVLFEVPNDDWLVLTRRTGPHSYEIAAVDPRDETGSTSVTLLPAAQVPGKPYLYDVPPNGDGRMLYGLLDSAQGHADARVADLTLDSGGATISNHAQIFGPHPSCPDPFGDYIWGLSGRRDGIELVWSWEGDIHVPPCTAYPTALWAYMSAVDAPQPTVFLADMSTSFETRYYIPAWSKDQGREEIAVSLLAIDPVTLTYVRRVDVHDAGTGSYLRTVFDQVSAFGQCPTCSAINIRSLDWSPDGEWLLLELDESGGPFPTPPVDGFYLAASDGSGTLNHITSFDGYAFFSAAVAPDGTAFAYLFEDPLGLWVRIMNLSNPPLGVATERIVIPVGPVPVPGQKPAGLEWGRFPLE